MLNTVKYILILFTIATVNLTVLYGQTGERQDTLTCYTNTELQKIANRVLRASECDTLLSIVEQQLSLSYLAADELKKVITTKDNIIDYKDSIINYKDSVIKFEREALKSTKKKLKWTKIGWLSTTIGLLSLVISSFI